MWAPERNFYRELDNRGTLIEQRFASEFTGHFFKGADMVTAADVTIVPERNVFWSRVPILVPRNALPALDKFPTINNYPIQTLMYFDATMRSRYAQLGIDVKRPAEEIALSLFQQGYDSWASIPEVFESEITVGNRSQRPITLGRNSQFLRFFYTNRETELVRGKELVDFVKNGGVAIGGTFGVDWGWSNDRYATGDYDDVGGLLLRIKPDQRRWIPPHPANKPIQIDDKTKRYRQEIDRRYLEDVASAQGHLGQIIFIAETNELTLDQSVNAVIDRNTTYDMVSLQSHFYVPGTHIESRLIDGGSNWGIRVEIETRAEGGVLFQSGKAQPIDLRYIQGPYAPHFVVLRIYRNAA